MTFKYDGSPADVDDAVQTFYQESAWVLAEELYDARRLARGLAGILIADEYWTPGELAACFSEAQLPSWVLTED